METALVWVWVVVTTVGFGVGLANVRDAEIDILAVEQRGLSNGLRVIARAVWRAQVLRTVQSGMLWVVAFMRLADYPSQPVRLLASAMLLTAVVVLVTVNGTMDRMAKQQVLRTPSGDRSPQG